MSTNGEGGGREIAYRMFAAEYDDASLSHTESDEERAPNYVVTPTGARVNRLFVVGALTEVTRVNEEMVRARVVDPTGAFVVYAGQYQPDELAYLERADPPSFVAVTGKARTFQPEDGDRIYTSVRPESIATVDAETRDRWIVNTAEQTVARIGAYAQAATVDAHGEDLADTLLEAGLEDGLAHGIPLAQGHYGTTPAYLEGLHELAIDAARVVAGDREQVEAFDRQPDDSKPDAPTFADLVDVGDLAVETAADDTDPLEAETGDEPSLEFADDSATDAGSTSDAESEPADRVDVSDDDEAVDTPDDDLESFDASDEDDLEDDDLGDFESGDGMYEMDEDEREQIEEQFGAEFTTGAEVDEPGEAGIDVPDPDDLEAEAGDTLEDEPEPKPETENTASETTEEPAADSTDESESAVRESTADDDDDEGTVDEDVDLQTVAIETMSDLDDGSGAHREDVIEAVVAETGADAEAVEEAVQDALMGGQCYEPDEETLKAI
ncbi:RPA family protein [Natrialbaceae archaeon A-gly3]